MSSNNTNTNQNGQKKGGRGFQRRNNQGRGRGQANPRFRSNQVKFQGATDALKGHIFDCGNRRQLEAYQETLRQIAVYVGKAYKDYREYMKYVT